MTDRKRLRLCFVVESGTDIRLVNELAERFELTIIARRIPRGLPISQTPECSFTLELGPTSRARFGALVFRRLSRKRKFDVVLVQGYALAALGANLASRIGGAPVYMLICSPTERYYRCRPRGSSDGMPFRSWEYLGLRTLARINGLVANHYVVISRHLEEVVRSHGTSAPIDVVPVYGVDSETFKPTSEPRKRIRERFGLPVNGSLLFFSSRIAPEKDSATLLRAFRMLLEEGREMWLLHRSGGYERFLQDAERAGVIERVIATDARHPLKGLAFDYQASDLCVQASKEEGLGFSALEALACETPVVAASVGGLRETVLDGQTGWTYPVGDDDALARCISAVLDNPHEAHRRAIAGRCLVLENFERATVFKRLELLFNGSASNARSRLDRLANASGPVTSSQEWRGQG